MRKFGPAFPQVIYLAKLAFLAAFYYGAARLGLHYASIGQSVSLVWPPTGIAFAALTLLGHRYWPGVALGAFLANAATPVPLLASASIALGNTLEALVAAYLLRRAAGPRPQLDDLRHVRILVLVAAPLGALCSAVIGPLTLWVTGGLPTPALPAAVAVWWTGDLLGALVVAPIFFAWAVPPQADDNTRRLIEVLVLCLGTFAVAQLGLGQLVATGVLRQVEYHYLLFPFVIWAALRFGARGASLMTFTVSAVAVGHTVQGGGPFVSASAVRTLFQVAGYLAVVAVTGLVLAAAARWERLQATKALAQSEERLLRALDAARTGTWFWSVGTNTLTWDDNLRRLYGLGPEDQVATYQDFLARVHPEDRAFVEETVRKILEAGGDLDYEYRVLLPDGRVRSIADQGEVHRDEQGRPVHLVGVCTDITERRMAEERLRQTHRAFGGSLMAAQSEAQAVRPQLLGLVRHAFGDRYEVDREVGRGGAARVFLAFDRAGQKVALKILHPEFLESVAADRFLREIRLVSRLSHPQIARLLDSGDRDWFVYLAMAFIDGPSLCDVLGRGRRMSVADTLRVACDLLDALDHAHQLGIVHRDVKPENVIISPDRGAVLLDFGIARAIVSSVSMEITRAGLTVGSSSYMSPEQINADQKIDGRSDLYSLGCVLFECLTGRPPFVWRKEAVVLQLHLTEPAPDVRMLRPDVPPQLARAINKALAKLPEERWQSAAEMRDILAICPAPVA